MIPQTTLVKSGITTSLLAFGTSRLHYLSGGARQRLLAAASDVGIAHFDTAPAYGDGLAEVELGVFLRGRRGRFVVATKYGILPDPLIEAWPSLAMPLRGARAIGRRFGLTRRTSPPLTVMGLRGSVEQSLRRLGTDYIDIFFLHEPQIDRIAAPYEILNELNRLREKGAIRAFGLAGAWQGIETLLPVAPELGLVIQTAENKWPSQAPPDITYSALASGSQHYLSPAIPTFDAAARLRCALKRRPNGVVIVSTGQLAHLNSLVGTVEAALKQKSKSAIP